MQPIVISPTIQEFNGKRFYLCGKYFQHKGLRLHRAVWEHHNGPILDGHHVHHEDEDRSNNQSDNLECLSPHEHLGGKHGEASAERGKVALSAAREGAAKWHGSEEGRKWHSKHFEESIRPIMDQQVDCTCEQCGKGYQLGRIAAHNSKFCSNACKSAWRRAAGLDDEQRQCAQCGAEFTANKYKKQKACSRDCGGKLSGLSRRGASGPV